MKKTGILLTVLLLAMVSSCKAQQSVQNKITNTAYQETTLPKDTTKLWIAEGDPTKQIVTIFLQGGPKGSFILWNARKDQLEIPP